MTDQPTLFELPAGSTVAGPRRIHVAVSYTLTCKDCGTKATLGDLVPAQQWAWAHRCEGLDAA